MRRCVVLVRGINVGRGNRLAMADLRDALARAGCTDVRTHLNSGNAVVTADPVGLAARVEAELPLAVRVVVLTADELAAVVAGCPWPAYAESSPALVHVAFLDRQPDPAVLAGLSAGHGDDELVVGERALYLRYAVSSLDSPLTALVASARLGVVATTRNWRTVARLAELT